eukprot:jgi/Tetstr1/428153/TSEL_018204.t1
MAEQEATSATALQSAHLATSCSVELREQRHRLRVVQAFRLPVAYATGCVLVTARGSCVVLEETCLDTFRRWQNQPGEVLQAWEPGAGAPCCPGGNTLLVAVAQFGSPESGEDAATEGANLTSALYGNSGTFGMAGTIFRHGNGQPEECPGLWSKALMPGVLLDWAWFVHTLPGVKEQLEAKLRGLPRHFRSAGSACAKILLADTLWCCLSVGLNYHAAPHTDADVLGAVIRFLDHVSRCSLRSNDLFLPELGMVLETPAHTLMWLRSERVEHGTMCPAFDGGVGARVSTARMLKTSVLSCLKAHAALR